MNISSIAVFEQSEMFKKFQVTNQTLKVLIPF